MRFRKYKGKFKVEMTDPDWIEPIEATLNAIEGEMQQHTTEWIVENAMSLLRARAVKLAHEVHRLRAERLLLPTTVWADDVRAAGDALNALSHAGAIYCPNGILILPKKLLDTESG